MKSDKCFKRHRMLCKYCNEFFDSESRYRKVCNQCKQNNLEDRRTRKGFSNNVTPLYIQYGLRDKR